MASPMSCSTGLRSRPSIGAGTRRRNGLEVVTMKARKAKPIQPCTESTSAFSRSGRLVPKAATRAPKSARMSTHRSIEPSWFPHTPVIL